MNKLKEINGKVYQEVEVVMLATNEMTFNSRIYTSKLSGILGYLNQWKNINGIQTLDCTPKFQLPCTEVVCQHLYFLSNEEIKEGNWYFDLDTKKICQWTMSHSIPSGFEQRVKRIIATTNTSLKIKTFYEIEGDQEVSLPQPSKEFIQAFTKSYNEGKPITKVLVEYDVITLNEDWSKRPVVVTNEYKLKVNSSNEITIKKVKDSYTREELRPIFLKLCHDTADYIEKGYDEKTEFNIDKWIEENL